MNMDEILDAAFEKAGVALKKPSQADPAKRHICRNKRWQERVRKMLEQGYGTADIAVKLGCDADLVSLELKILTENGELPEIVKKIRAAL